MKLKITFGIDIIKISLRYLSCCLILLHAYNTSAQSCNLGNVSYCYGPLENTVITYCPDTPITQSIVVRLNTYDFLAGDDITFFDGTGVGGTILGGPLSGSGTLGLSYLATPVIEGGDGCVTVRIRSNLLGSCTDLLLGPGPTDFDVFCQTICVPPVADFSISDSTFCSTEAFNQIDTTVVTFDATASLHGTGTSFTSYQWNFGDGSLDTTNVPITTHAYPLSGGYITTLKVVDDLDCQSANLIEKVIQIAGAPDLSLFSDAVNDSLCLESTIAFSSEIEAFTWKEPIEETNSPPTDIPDGTGQIFSSSIFFEQFSVDSLVSNGDSMVIRVNMEHSYAGDLNIRLVCPDGTGVRLLNFNTNMMGNVNIGGAGDANAPPESPAGSGYDYFFSMDPANPVISSFIGPSFTDVQGLELAGGVYRPDASLANFNGCPLNGEWRIEFTDNFNLDDGTLFDWSIQFATEDDNKREVEEFTNSYTPGTWTGEGITDTTAVPSTLGSQYYTYTVVDDYGCTFADSIQITVLPNSENFCSVPPIANQDTVVLDTGIGFTFDVTLNDTDINGDLDISSVNLLCPVCLDVTNGSVIDNGNGNFTYTSNPNYAGLDSLIYQICDFEGLCDTSFVRIEVGDFNRPPVATNDTITVSEDMSVNFDVSANDSDQNNNLDIGTYNVSCMDCSGPAFGTLTNLNNGQFSYEPFPEYFGSDSFVYEVCDSLNLCDRAVVNINVTGVDDAPIALSETVTTDEDISIQILVLNNDNDFDDNLDTISLNTLCVNCSQPAQGSLTINNGEILYTPIDNYFGQDSFVYEICDLTGLCDTAQVSININPINDAPVATEDNAFVFAVGGSTIDIRPNDFDVDGNIDFSTTNTTCVTCSGPSSGLLNNNNDGTFTYTPLLLFTGNDEFIYEVCDTEGLCDTALVTVIESINLAPVAVLDLAVVEEDDSVSILVLLNDTDLNFNIDPSSLSIVSNPSNGSTSIDNGAILYTPAPNFFGVDVFEYSICDTENLCSSTTVTVTVSPVLDLIVALPDVALVSEDDSVATDVTANDIDLDGAIDLSTLNVSVAPTNGTTSVDTITGLITYTPNANYNGLDTYTYKICDDSNNCSTAVVAVTIDPALDLIVALPDTDTVLEDDSVATDVTANDIDIDGSIDLSTLAVIDLPVNGTVSVDISTGLITYTPDPNFNGTDTYTYQICDDANNCSSATVEVTVEAVADDIVANDDDVMTEEDTAIDIEVLMNDMVEGTTIDTSSLVILTQPDNGIAAVNTLTGQINYLPTENFYGNDSLVYQICDAANTCDTASVFIGINPINDAPIALDETTVSFENIPVEIFVTQNDNDDADGVEGGLDFNSLELINAPQNGEVTIDTNNGTFTYSPLNEFSGVDSFTYVICDIGFPLPALCDTASVVIEIYGDFDNDGIPDIFDTDDDNNGVSDYIENGGINPDADDDNDGIINAEDNVCSGCSYSDVDTNNDGIPDVFDIDGDGFPNHRDIDNDNDGMTDMSELGLTDADNDGMVDDFVDENNNGLHDIYDPSAGGMAVEESNFDQDGVPDYKDIDSDNDGITDNRESQDSGAQNFPSGLDADNDGWDDAYDPDGGGTPITVKDTDEDGMHDFRDNDSDADGIVDSIEGNDANYDGDPDSFRTFVDSDNDGLDDGFDTSNGATVANANGTNVPVQDTNSDGIEDYRDLDSDGDGFTDFQECAGGPQCSDLDGDGFPDYLDQECNSNLNTPTLTTNEPVCSDEEIYLYIQQDYSDLESYYSGIELSYLWINGVGDTLQFGTLENFEIPADSVSTVSPFAAKVFLNGCVSDFSPPSSVLVTYPPSATASNNGPVCEGEEVVLTAGFVENAEYEWRKQGEDAVLFSGQIYTIENLEETSTYEVTVIKNGCPGDSTGVTTVEILDNPQSIAPYASYTLQEDCSVDSLRLFAGVAEGNNGELNFEWNGPNAFFSTLENPVIENIDSNNNGSYSLTVSNIFGCTATASVLVENIPDTPSQPVITYQDNVCSDGSITLTAPEYTGTSVEYQWYFNGDLVGPNNREFIIAPANDSHEGLYSVIVIADECTLVSDPVFIEVTKRASLDVIVPEPILCTNGQQNVIIDASTGTGTAPFSYTWTGPNDYFSVNEDAEIVNVTAEDSGIYTVFVTDANGCTDSQSIPVDITDAPPVPVILSSGPSCEGETIVLTIENYNGAEVDFTWSTPNGNQQNISGFNTNQLTISPVSASLHAGDYIVSVFADNCTVTSDTFTVEVYNSPDYFNPTATYEANEDCSPATLFLLVNAEQAGDYLYEWTGPNGFSSSAENPAIANATAAANGIYELTVTDINGGCQVSYATEIVDNINDPISQPNISGENEVCEGELAVLQATQYDASSVSYIWTLNDTIISGENNFQLSISEANFTDAGNYQVTAVVGECSISSQNFTLSVFANPELEMSFAVTGTCGELVLELSSGIEIANSTTVYSWNGPAGFTSSAENPTIFNATADNNGTYSLTATNSNGCMATASMTVSGVSSDLETPIIFSNNPVCEEEEIYLQVQQSYSAAISIEWYNGVGEAIGTGEDFSIPANSPQVILPFTAIAVSGDCISDTSNPVSPDIIEGQQLTAANNGPVCEGAVVQLFAIGSSAADYVWINSSTGAFVSNEQNPIIDAPTTDTEYQVTISGQDACASENTAVTSVEVLPAPEVSVIAGGGHYCLGTEITLSATNFANVDGLLTYSWTAPNGSTSTQVLTANQVSTWQFVLEDANYSGTYSLTVKTEDGCESSTVTTIVSVQESTAAPVLTVTDDGICEGETIFLHSSAYNETNIQYEWYFTGTDNNIQFLAVTNTPDYNISDATANNTGNYNVIVTINDCPSVISNTVYVGVFGTSSPPTASSNSSADSPLCEGGTLLLSTPFVNGAEYEWHGPNDFTSNSSTPVITDVTVADAGNYFALVSLNECSTVISTTAIVHINPSPAAPVIANNSPVCAGDDFTLFVDEEIIVPNDSSLVFSWYDAATDTLIFTGYTAEYSMNSTDNLAGGYYLIVTEDSCVSQPSELTFVTVNEPIDETAIAGDDIQLCLSDTTNLQAVASTEMVGSWASLTGASIADVTDAETEVYDLSLGENIFVWSLSVEGCGVVSEDTMIVMVNSDIIDFADAGSDETFCGVDNVSLNAALATTAEGTWTQSVEQAATGVIINSPNAENSTITGLEEGQSYTFVWSLSQGNCANYSSDEVMITIEEQPAESAFILNLETHLCDEDRVLLEAVTPTTATGTWSTNGAAVISSPSETTTYVRDLSFGENIFYWTLSNDACTDFSIDSVSIYYEQPITAEADNFITTINEPLVQVDLLENDIFSGSAEALTISIERLPRQGFAEIDAEGYLTYEPGRNYFGQDSLIYQICNDFCPDDCQTAQVMIDVTGGNEEGECIIPNILTPNGNGLNDALIIPCLSTFIENKLTIYNRRGDQVYFAAPYNNDWEGTYRGKDLPAGTYFYVLEMEVDNVSKTTQGYLTIFR